MTPKEKHKAVIIEHIADPEKDFPDRTQMAKLCGITKRALHHHFTPDEFRELEAEAMTLRRKRYAKFLPKIDRALIDEAESGDTAAIKLAYQRFEGWSEKNKHEVSGPDGKSITINYKPK